MSKLAIHELLGMEGAMSGVLEDWPEIVKAFQPASAPHAPSDKLMRFMAGLYCTAEGRELFEWLADITFRAPYPVTGGNIQELAFAAAKHQARAAVGSVVVHALQTGLYKLEERKSDA